jgi:transglutaminase-like putative cysteine protease
LDTIKQPYNALRDRLDNAFASLRSSVGIVTTYYGDSVFLGRGNTLSDQQIMEVGVPVDLPSNVRLYWRARAYDRYQNGQWISSITNTAPFNPESDNLIHEASAARFPAVFEFSTALPLSTIYTPSQPNWVSRPAILHGEIQTGATIDLSGVRAEPGIAAGETYVVQASPPNVTISQLRNAGTEYPEWIRARYLQLPDTITDRTRAKALEIAAGLDNPYDITSAITDWLRNNITYSQTIPNPPDDQDVVDWFLFDLQQGFCNYYATAEVILLRSLGIPARWVVGYAQGEEQIEPRYIVRQRDAHAWPEVYFPGFGWVEFEPTASQPAIARLVGEVDPNDPNRGAFPGDAPTLEEELRQLREEREPNSVDPNNPALTQGDYVSIFLSIAAALLLVFLGMRFFLPPFPVMLVAVWQRLGLQPPQRLILWAEQASARAAARIKLPPLPILVETSILKVGARPPAFIQRWSQMAQLPALSRSYLEINQALKRIGRPGTETETPLERATMLGAALPAADQPAHELVTEYQLSLFSTQPPNEDTAYQAGQVIRKLSLRKMYRNWLTRLQESPRSRRRSLFDPSERDEPPEKTFEI